MKTTSVSLLAAVLVTALSPALAQQAGRPVRPRTPPPQPPGQPQTASIELRSNVKLSLEGNLFGMVPTDFSITSGGSSFSTDLPVKMDADTPIIGTCSGTLIPGSAWTVQISLSARIPMQLGNPGNVQFRDFNFNTSVRIAPGKKVVLWEKGDQKLVLGLEELPE